MRMAFNVYRVQFTMAMPDPDMPSVMPDPDMPRPRYHNVIFVETEADGSGAVHHVTGDITSGMTYATRREGRPEDSEIFVQKEFIGTVESAIVNWHSGISHISRENTRSSGNTAATAEAEDV
ncbi:hypothetical protein V498_07289 [Pseudogymnoascus sp. VKM F-4517 (FW-2822)]|nr:hypothetical protein V498_07289 [Pseudogymnoascus sp. VKM F-4517 (FW-2822)]